MKRSRFFLFIFLFTLSLVISACTELPEKFTINFDPNGGTEVESVIFDENSIIVIPNNPTKEGYIFDGWYLDNDEFASPFSANSLLNNPLQNDITVYAKWVLQDSETTVQLKSIYQLAVQADAFEGTYEEWLETVRGPQGIPGEVGKSSLLRINGTVLEWQQEGEISWISLFDLNSLKGTDGINGKNITLQVSEGYIQWQNEGDTTWTDLISLSTLTGADGLNGEDGEDGREVLFQVVEGYIQWQYEGDTTWTNLIDFNTLIDADVIMDEIETLKLEIDALQKSIIDLQEEIVNIDIQQQLTEHLENATNSVIGIEIYDFGFVTSSGSGIIYKSIDGAYYAVTNFHVVEYYTDIKVLLPDNSKVSAEVVGFDFYSDLAVLRFNSTADFYVSSFGDSNQVTAGDFVVAIGSPLGSLNYNSSTLGIVSGVNRLLYDDWDYYYGELFIQHDAAINFGNSGGALINLDGEVIGINTAKYIDYGIEGLGFAIPSNVVKNVISSIEKGEPYLRAAVWYDWMINVNAIRNNPIDYPDYYIPLNIFNGVYVENPSNDGVLGLAGLNDGDIILKVGGIDVSFWYEVIHHIHYMHTFEEVITFTVYRDAQIIELVYDPLTYILEYYSYQYLELSSGDFYIGEMYGFDYHGYGTYFYANGNIYEGEFNLGQFYGYGTFYFLSGNYYSGYWIDSLNSEEGTFYYTDGAWIDGVYIDGIFTTIGNIILDINDYLNPGDLKYYEFTVTATTTITAYTLGSTDTYGYLTDSNFNVITQDDDSGEGVNFMITYTLAPGTYYIFVEGFDELESGYFDLIIITTIENIILDISDYLNLGDQKYYEFTLTTTTTITAYTLGSTDTYGYLTDSNFNIIAQDDDSGEGVNFMITYTLAPGTYYIFVEGYDEFESGYFDLIIIAD